MGLLDQITNHIASLNPELVNAAGGLLNYGKDRAKYIGGLLDDNSEISRDLQGWHKKTQAGLADQLEGRQTPAADYAYQQMMNMAGVAPLGMIAWHGSPHKFDKFSLDKIGTGEGAQAYGHGLYLAESPEVAATYSNSMKSLGPNMKYRADGSELKGLESSIAADIASNGKTIAGANAKANGPEWLDAYNRIKDKTITYGQLYKTDIPDEAVARFLDWDKPLSQQAPEVQKKLAEIAGESADSFSKKMLTNPSAYGEDLHKALTWLGDNSSIGADRANAAEILKKQGIPGIRYLDGGSRSAGQGSSNFVVFDPEMIRILERNGQPTGQQPWALGEWIKAQK